MGKKDSEQSGVLRNIFSLGFVSFFTDVSSEMVFSLLPTFVLELTGSTAVLGLIEGAAEALGYMLRSISGFFSDKFRKRKIIVFVGYAFSSIVKPLFAVAQTATQVFVIRVADRVGKAVRTAPRDALLSESVPDKRRGAAFGLHRTLDQAGAIIGPLIASAFMLSSGLATADKARIVFWVSFIPASIALLILLLFVQERVGKPSGEIKLLSGARTVFQGDFRLFLLVAGIFSLGAFDFSFILVNASGSGIPDPLIPIVYAVINIAHTVVAIPAGLLSDRIGKEKVLVMGYGAFLTTALLLLFSHNVVLFAYLLAVIFGVYFGIVETVQRALVPRYAESALRGTAYGLYYLVVGSAFFVANTIVGALWKPTDPSAAAIYSITLSSIAIAGMLLLLVRQKRTSSNNAT